MISSSRTSPPSLPANFGRRKLVLMKLSCRPKWSVLSRFWASRLVADRERGGIKSVFEIAESLAAVPVNGNAWKVADFMDDRLSNSVEQATLLHLTGMHFS